MANLLAIVDLGRKTRVDPLWASLISPLDEFDIKYGFLFKLTALTESITAMKHDVHCLASSGYPETYSWSSIYAIRNAGLSFSQFDLKVESPKCDPSFGMKSNSLHLSELPNLLPVPTSESAIAMR